ncbi:hypothetical protein RMQ97_08720 [Maricaulis sp. D1M11]|uniref:hypothetical protein n=1 Tax=Maricaulis sp. D1M11 TaxID=3076117 RepID=UPI0039B47E09
MEFIDQILVFLMPVYTFFEPGLLAHASYGTAAVNWMHLGIQMGVIALVLALLMREFSAILIFTVVAVIIHVIVDQVMPIVRSGGDMASFNAAEFGAMFTDTIYYLFLGAIALGYFLGLIILFLLKSLIFRGDD